MKPTRTDNNKPSQSTPIRKGKLSSEEIKKTAEELTKNQPQYGVVHKKVGKILKDGGYDVIEPICVERLQVVEVPAIEPAPQKGNYKVFAETIKAHIGESGQFEVTGDQLKLFFPQRHYGGQVAIHLKRYYGLSYRRVENGRNDTYVFFVEPTREELIVKLTSAETKVIELEDRKQYFEKEANYLRANRDFFEKQTKELKKDYQERYYRRGEDMNEMGEENTQLKSELSNSQKTNYILFAFAIGSVITIILKSVAL